MVSGHPVRPGECPGTRGAPCRGVPAALLGRRVVELSGGPDCAIIVMTKKTRQPSSLPCRPLFIESLLSTVFVDVREVATAAGSFLTGLNPAGFLPPAYLLVFGATGGPGMAGEQFALVCRLSPRDTGKTGSSWC